MKWETNVPMELLLDISPHVVYSSRNEPCEAGNSLVLQLRNIASQEITLYNDEARTDYDFLPPGEAVPIDGLTMIYFTFPLGCTDGCLTTEEYFKRIRFSCPEPFTAQRVGEDSLVLFPLCTVAFSPFDIAEMTIQDLVTGLAPGSSALCRAVMISPAGTADLNQIPIHIARHPLQIPVFEAAPGYHPAAFGDKVRFHYRVMGADSCVFSPGDAAMEKNGRLLANGAYESTLYQKTRYTLSAACGEERISSVFELAPMRAAIRSFFASASPKAGDGSRTVALKFTVENTRHAYLNRIGRIEVESGVEKTITVTQDEPVATYTLSVENEDGLVQKTCIVK